MSAKKDESARSEAAAALRIRDLECEGAMASLLGSLVRIEPSGAWLESLAGSGVFEEAPFAGDDGDVAAGLLLLGGWARSWRAGEEGAGLDAVYADHMALFVGPGAPLAPPWESAFAHGGEALVFQQETLDVRACYRGFGLQVENLHHEPDDHIGYELEFVAALARKEAEALDGGDPVEAERVAAARADFLESHPTRWADGWADLVAEHARTDFYRGVGLLVKGVLRAAS